MTGGTIPSPPYELCKSCRRGGRSCLQTVGPSGTTRTTCTTQIGRGGPSGSFGTR